MKHTFSCVNGTVFNQMSFTCTRQEDSIPCQASAKYFYLNKRNGDPKAYFLTDDDITSSPATGRPAGALPTSTTSFRAPPTTPVAFSTTTYSPIDSLSGGERYFTPIDSNDEDNHHHHGHRLQQAEPSSKFSASRLHLSNKKAAVFHRDDQPAYNPHQHHGSSHNDNTYLEESNDDPINPIRIIKPEQLKPLPPPPPALPSIEPKSAPKYFDSLEEDKKFAKSSFYSKAFEAKPSVDLRDNVFMSNLKSGVKYSPKAKYEPVDNNRLVGYSSVHSQVNADDKYSSFPMTTTTTTNNRPNTRPQYKSIFDEAPARGGGDKQVYKFPTTYYRSDKAKAKKSDLTPASFSKLYMDSMAKYQGRSAFAAPTSKVDKPAKSLGSSFLYSPPREYTPSHRKMSPKPEQPEVPVYSNNPNRYVVPSSVRIIEQGGFRPMNNAPAPPTSTQTLSAPLVKPASILSTNGNGKISSMVDSPPENEPVRISFFANKADHPTTGTANEGGGDNVVSNYGDVRYVKQVKGKSLLIDPSLEKDPARDNILAQVIEMLNKYN